MCKYCIDVGKTSGEYLERETIDRYIDLGEMGNYNLKITLGNDYTFGPVMHIGIGLYLGTPTIKKHIKITYCPFCGRRLKKEPKKQS